MTRRLLTVFGLLLLSLRPAASQDWGALRTRLDARIRLAPARAVGVYYRSLARPDSLLIDANLRFHAASTMKIPVMIQIFRDADAGLLRLDDSLTVHTAFPSLINGEAFTVDKADDSDSTLYDLVGRNRSVRELLERMITRSSNLATDILIERVGAARAQASARALGAWSMQVLRGVEDGAAYRAHLNNTTTARDLGVLLEAIATGRAASRPACDSMLAILGRQEFNEGIPVGVPPGTRVAHKTGWIGEVVYHDAAIVYPPSEKSGGGSGGGGGGYVLVIVTEGIKQDSVAHNLVADLSRLVYAAATARL
jgi:beta-lactamase class A